MTLPTQSTHTRPTLLIADDDVVVLSALSSQLAPDFEVIAVAADAPEAIDLAERHRPDAALIDVQMPDGGAMAAVPRIASCSPYTRMVVISGDECRQSVLDLLKAGASAYIRKGLSGPDISRILTQALSVGDARPRG